MIKARLGQIAPLLSVSDWIQGQATNLDRLVGQVVLVEVFQVNCPGCFLYSLPQAIDLYQRYAGQGLVVLAVATAFEDFDKNTRQNLNSLIDTGEVVGETLLVLAEQGQLRNGRWPLRLPFPVAMDNLIKVEKPVAEQAIESFIRQNVPDFGSRPEDYRRQIRMKILHYLQALEYQAETFERFDLQGTPSHILVDKRGVLRACHFGVFPELESQIQWLLAEPAQA
jgi:thiol-disulfide isomerase/thioredoxin